MGTLNTNNRPETEVRAEIGTYLSSRAEGQEIYLNGDQLVEALQELAGLTGKTILGVLNDFPELQRYAEAWKNSRSNDTSFATVGEEMEGCGLSALLHAMIETTITYYMTEIQKAVQANQAPDEWVERLETYLNTCLGSNGDKTWQIGRDIMSAKIVSLDVNEYLPRLYEALSKSTPELHNVLIEGKKERDRVWGTLCPNYYPPLEE